MSGWVVKRPARQPRDVPRAGGGGVGHPWQNDVGRSARRHGHLGGCGNQPDWFAGRGLTRNCCPGDRRRGWDGVCPGRLWTGASQGPLARANRLRRRKHERQGGVGRTDFAARVRLARWGRSAVLTRLGPLRGLARRIGRGWSRAENLSGWQRRLRSRRTVPGSVVGVSTGWRRVGLDGGIAGDYRRDLREGKAHTCEQGSQGAQQVSTHQGTPFPWSRSWG